VLVDAAWRVVETDPDGSAGVGTAEALLLATGAAADDVDLAQVRRLPPTPRAYGVEDSRRILRTLARRAGSLDAADWALLGCLAWDSSSRAEHPRLWLQTVMTAPTYLGAPLDNGEVARLPRGAVPAALSRAVADGVDPVEAGRRLAGVLPRSPSQRAALLVQLSHAPEHGMTATFLGALTARTTTVADQAAVLRQRWPDFVDEAGLPPYLATALAPRGTPGARLRLSRRGVLVLALLLLVVAVVAVLALTTWLPRG
jgi:hypothetical protein